MKEKNSTCIFASLNLCGLYNIILHSNNFTDNSVEKYSIPGMKAKLT